jgi:hypothetical protein
MSPFGDYIPQTKTGQDARAVVKTVSVAIENTSLDIASKQNVSGLFRYNLPTIEGPKGKFGLKAGSQI